MNTNQAFMQLTSVAGNSASLSIPENTVARINPSAIACYFQGPQGSGQTKLLLKNGETLLVRESVDHVDRQIENWSDYTRRPAGSVGDPRSEQNKSAQRTGTAG